MLRDQPAIRQIMRETEAAGYRFQDVIAAIVNSVPFQMRQAQRKAEGSAHDHYAETSSSAHVFARRGHCPGAPAAGRDDPRFEGGPVHGGGSRSAPRLRLLHARRECGQWRPKGEGAGYQLSEALAPLAPHKQKFLVISGLSSDPDRTKAGFHDRALASFMTGVEMARGKIQVGISVDQVAAQALGKETQFASLELATEYNGALGGVSYKTATTPLALRAQSAPRLRAPFRRRRQNRSGRGCGAPGSRSEQPRHGRPRA